MREQQKESVWQIVMAVETAAKRMCGSILEEVERAATNKVCGSILGEVERAAKGKCVVVYLWRLREQQK